MTAKEAREYVRKKATEFRAKQKANCLKRRPPTRKEIEERLK